MSKRKKRSKKKKVNFITKGNDKCQHSACECESKDKKLNLLQTVEPEGTVSAVEGEWEELHLAVDSGATETVLGEEPKPCAADP